MTYFSQINHRVQFCVLLITNLFLADVVWEKEGVVLQTEGKALAITNVPYNTKLIIRSCKRSDQGVYTVTATNSVGKDSVTVTLKVSIESSYLYVKVQCVY